MGRARVGHCLATRSGTEVSSGVTTHPARASVARPPGDTTLGLKQGELGADFTALGVCADLDSLIPRRSKAPFIDKLCDHPISYTPPLLPKHGI